MATIRLEKTLRAPIERVFELLSDHGNYAQFRGITRSKLTREGDSEPNGRGALRSIASGPIRFEEEITRFDRPTRMDYLIRKVNLPLEHEGGTIILEDLGGATQVLWSSSFQVPIRFAGGPLGSVMAAVTKRGFSSILDDVELLS